MKYAKILTTASILILLVTTPLGAIGCGTIINYLDPKFKFRRSRVSSLQLAASPPVE